MKSLSKLIHSKWLIVPLIAFGLFFTIVGSASSPAPIMFAYDGQTQTRMDYDRRPPLRFSDDAASMPVAYEKENPTAARGGSFADFVKCFAAERIVSLGVPGSRVVTGDVRSV